MRNIGVVVVVGCALVASAAFAKVKRTKIECAKVSITKLEPGWGHIPAALQKLPPGATLCGVNKADVAFITSELETDALQKFYAPLFASLGCKPLACKPDTLKMMECACPGKADPRAGYVRPAPYDQQYQLGYSP